MLKLPFKSKKRLQFFRSKSSASSKSAKSKQRPSDASNFKRPTLGIKKIRLHRSFRRSYREDIRRDLPLPGLFQHAAAVFRHLFRHWKIYFGLTLIVVLFNIFLVGLMNEGLYRQLDTSIDETSQGITGGKIGNVAKAGLLLISTLTTGGLNQSPYESQQIFGILLFLVTWLVAIYLCRHLLAGHAVRVRDGLYGGLSPLISTAVILLVMAFQAVPLMLVMIAYSAAVNTEFLATPFYALVFFVFACIFILISLYLLSSSFLALVAVTSPGIYPLEALSAVSSLILGRRIKFIVRLLFVFVILGLIWLVILLPIILLDLWLKSSFAVLAGLPLVPFVLQVATTISFIYLALYFYLLYRQILELDQSAE